VTAGHATACTCRDCCLDRAAQVYVDGLAALDAMTPTEAARAAGCRTEPEIAAFVARLRAEREELASTA
jgi:hypothetical protein